MNTEKYEQEKPQCLDKEPLINVNWRKLTVRNEPCATWGMHSTKRSTLASLDYIQAHLVNG